MTISTNINEQKTVFVPITSISTDIKKMQPVLHLTVITTPPPPQLWSTHCVDTKNTHVQKSFSPWGCTSIWTIFGPSDPFTPLHT